MRLIITVRDGMEKFIRKDDITCMVIHQDHNRLPIWIDGIEVEVIPELSDAEFLPAKSSISPERLP